MKLRGKWCPRTRATAKPILGLALLQSPVWKKGAFAPLVLNAGAGPKAGEVTPKTPEVTVKPGEVGPKSAEVKAKAGEVTVKPDFEVVMKGHRKDLRATCARVWGCLAENAGLTQREIAVRLVISESSVLAAMNALQEVGLLKKEGYGKGRTWIVKTVAGEPEAEG